MNDRPASGPRSPDPFPALRIVALIAAILGVLVLAAAAFVLSYPGIHQLARTAGMSVTLARVFPVIFDALLVVAIAAVLSLHGAGWWRRGYSWLITLLLLAAMAAGGVLHALHPHIPRRPAEVTAAVLPWALLLIAFSLLLSILRQFRQARLSPAAQPATQPATGQTAPVPAGLDEILSPGGARIVPAQPSRPSTTRAQSTSPASADTKPTAPAPGGTKPVAPAPADAEPAGPAPADAQPGDTDRMVTKPADLTTPTGTGWGSRTSPDTGAASNGTAEHRPAATGSSAAGSNDTGSAGTGSAGNRSTGTTPTGKGAADQSAEGAGRAQTKPADAVSSVYGPTDSSRTESAPDSTSPAGPADRAEDEPTGTRSAAATPAVTPGEPEAAPGSSSGADRPAGPGEPPASPGAGTIHVPHQPMRAPVPAPSPHFDRLRSTPTPPEDDTDSDA